MSTEGISYRPDPLTGFGVDGHHRPSPFRLVFAAAAVVGVVLAIGYFVSLRMIEADITNQILQVLGLHSAVSDTRPMVVFDAASNPHHGPMFVGLVITPECSVALLAVPLLVLFGILNLVTRTSERSLLMGLAAGLAVMVLANEIRLVLIAYFVRWIGYPNGYDIAHLYVGSVLAVIGFALGVLTFMRLATRERRRI